MSKYDSWIESWLERNGAVKNGGYGRCRDAAEAMAGEFPELSIVKGHVHCPPPWFKRGHWWCLSKDGDIVDPTAAQFPCIFKYEPYTEGDDVRLGKCMNCGEEIWGPDPDSVYSTVVCGKDCARVLEAQYAQDFA